MTSSNDAQSVAAKSEIPVNNTPNGPRQNENPAIVEASERKNTPVGTKERKNDFVGTKQDPTPPVAPEARNTADVDRQNDPRDKISERSDEHLPNWSVLGRKAIQAMESLYLQHGDSYSEIADTFGGYSKSAISRHLSYLADDPEKQRQHQESRTRFHGDGNVNVNDGQQPQQNIPLQPAASNQSPAVEPASTIPLIIYEDGSNGSPSFPRVNAEVYGPRPRIVEESYNNGNDVEASATTDSGNRRPRPIRVVVDPADSRLQGFFLELLHLAATRGMSFESYFMSGQCIEDLHDCAFAKSLVPGDGEHFRQTLLEQMRKANLHDRLRTETGLES